MKYIILLWEKLNFVCIFFSFWLKFYSLVNVCLVYKVNFKKISDKKYEEITKFSYKVHTISLILTYVLFRKYILLTADPF